MSKNKNTTFEVGWDFKDKPIELSFSNGAFLSSLYLTEKQAKSLILDLEETLKEYKQNLEERNQYYNEKE